jgi:Ni,Fe-hydrogenase III small subunit
MLKILRKIFKVGIVTEKLFAAVKRATSKQHVQEAQAMEQKLPVVLEQSIEQVGSACKKIIEAKFKGSLAIRQVDAGSCNGCELEIHALNNPFYDLERFGMHFVASPRHADLLLVTGPVSRHMEAALLATYNATPAPKLVLAVGDCGACGGEFGHGSYASVGAISNVIPVDGVIRGCPPTPLVLLQGIFQLLYRCY